MSSYKTFNYFINAYFHQDWREDAKKSAEILKLFLTSEDIENINKLKNDIEKILENENIDNFFSQNVEYFNPQYDFLEDEIWHGSSNKDWLKFIESEIKKFLSKS